MKTTLIAGALAATIATAANAQGMNAADECYFDEIFETVHNLPAGVHITTSFDAQQSIIDACENETGIEATGFSLGLTRVEIDGNRSLEFSTFE